MRVVSGRLLRAVAVLAAGTAAWMSLSAAAAVPDPAVRVAAGAVRTMASAVAATDIPAVTAPMVTAGAAWAPQIIVTPRTARWSVPPAERRDAERVASELSLDQAAGRVIVAAYSGHDGAAAAEMVGAMGLGGVILMGGATHDGATVRAITASVRDAAGDRDGGVIVTADEEGGTVSRLRGVIDSYPGFMAAGAAVAGGDAEAVTTASAAMAGELAHLGLTMDLAPIADVTTGLSDPVIRSRSAGDDPGLAARAVSAAVAGFVDAGVVPVLKHFPGHGSVATDSHEAVPTHSASLTDLERRDLVPFARAIDSGAPAVMMSHVAVEAWGGIPASLDPEAYRYLREALGFDGLIVTDALNMGAVAGQPGEAAVAALAAGADVLLMPADPRAARDAIVAAVESGALPRERLDDAVAHVILAGRWQDGLEPPAAPAGAAYDLAVAGATVATADCEEPLVRSSARVAGGTEADRARITAALEKRGVEVGASGPLVRLLGSDGTGADGDVVVALAGPWGLEESRADAYVGLYGRSAQAMAALADILTGEAAPGGAWPVGISLPYDACR